MKVELYLGVERKKRESNFREDFYFGAGGRERRIVVGEFWGYIIY